MHVCNNLHSGVHLEGTGTQVMMQKAKETALIRAELKDSAIVGRW